MCNFIQNASTNMLGKLDITKNKWQTFEFSNKVYNAPLGDRRR